MGFRFLPSYRYVVFACAGLAALIVGGCVNDTVIGVPSYQTTAHQGIERTYRLGIGDKLKITVFDEPDLSGEFEVNALGNVAVPLVGDIAAQKLPIQKFRENVRQKLAAGYLNQPRVNVEVLNYRSIFVHGEVRNGGEFTYKNGLKIRDAVAMAGGYTYRANKAYVMIVREGEQEFRLDLPTTVPVLPGDNIRVLERFF